MTTIADSATSLSTGPRSPLAGPLCPPGAVGPSPRLIPGWSAARQADHDLSSGVGWILGMRRVVICWPTRLLEGATLHLLPSFHLPMIVDVVNVKKKCASVAL